MEEMANTINPLFILFIRTGFYSIDDLLKLFFNLNLYNYSADVNQCFRHKNYFMKI